MTDFICPKCDGGFPKEVVDNCKDFTGGSAKCPWCGESLNTWGYIDD